MPVSGQRAVCLTIPMLLLASRALAFGPELLRHAATRADSVVYSNLGPKGDRYSDVEVWLETGQDVSAGFIATAFAFKTTKYRPFLLTRLKLALGYVPSMGKTGTFELVLANDNTGIPGTRLLHQKIKTNWTGLCCKLLTVDLQKPVRVVYGQTYWVITLAKPETFGKWFTNYNSLSGLAAVSYDEGRSWQSQPNSRNIGAFAVYGTPAGE